MFVFPLGDRAPVCAMARPLCMPCLPEGSALRSCVIDAARSHLYVFFFSLVQVFQAFLFSPFLRIPFFSPRCSCSPFLLPLSLYSVSHVIRFCVPVAGSSLTRFCDSLPVLWSLIQFHLFSQHGTSWRRLMCQWRDFRYLPASAFCCVCLVTVCFIMPFHQGIYSEQTLYAGNIVLVYLCLLPAIILPSVLCCRVSMMAVRMTHVVHMECASLLPITAHSCAFLGYTMCSYAVYFGALLALFARHMSLA